MGYRGLRPRWSPRCYCDFRDTADGGSLSIRHRADERQNLGLPRWLQPAGSVLSQSGHNARASVWRSRAMRCGRAAPSKLIVSTLFVRLSQPRPLSSGRALYVECTGYKYRPLQYMARGFTPIKTRKVMSSLVEVDDGGPGMAGVPERQPTPPPTRQAQAATNYLWYRRAIFIGKKVVNTTLARRVTIGRDHEFFGSAKFMWPLWREGKSTQNPS